MKKYIVLWGIICCVCSLVAAQQKYALVIGNGAYQAVETLVNPVNDATDVAGRLKRIGYQVELRTNLRNVDMSRAVNDYIRRLSANPQNEGFFWYAGHGVQIDGENYLLPVDVETEDDVAVKHSSYPLNRLIESFEKNARNKVNIVVLDACRNNPFRNMVGGKRNLSRGLAVIPVELPPDLFILFSTRAGQVAADGERGKRNSPFAEAFMKYMESNDDFGNVIRRITRETMTLTNNGQQPYTEGSIISMDYYSLNPRTSVTPPVPVSAPVAVQPTPAPAPKPATVQPAPSPAPIVKPESGSKTYKIGDTGPGGGIVFYVKGNSGLEVSPLLGTYNWDEAKTVARNYKGGGLSDWYLPSKDELNLIYQNLQMAGIVNLGTDSYWSSSEANNYRAWRQRFSHGSQGNYTKSNAFVACAIRVFNY